MAGESLRTCKVVDVAAVERNALVGGPFGSELVSRDYVPFGIPVIRGANMGRGRWVAGEFVYVTPQKADSLAANCAKPGDVVFTQRGTLGQVAIVPKGQYERYLISQSQMKLTVAADKADPLFIYYLFTGPEQQEHIRNNAIQTGVPHTNLGILRGTPIRLPALPEQKRIAHILGTIDDKIELNRRMNATLEAMSRAIFKSWFVDFDPVRQKAAGKQPVGMDAKTAALFPDSFEDSEIGEVPKGWRVGQVRSFVEGLYDGPHATPAKSDDGAVFLGIDNLTGTGLDLSKVRHIGEEDWPKWTRRVMPRQSDIVFSYEATIGFFAMIPPRLRCCLGRRLALVRPFLREENAHYLYHWFIAEPFQRYLHAHAVSGATVSRVPLIDFPAYPVLMAHKAIVNVFEKIATAAMEQIQHNHEQIATLAALRDTLLPKLLSGEIRIPEAEQAVEEATA